MKKFMFILMAATTILTGCRTQSVAYADYDQRPENKQPVLERPAWPNYDLHNDRSFAAFSNVQTAWDNSGKGVVMENGTLTHGRYTLYRCKEATYLCYDWSVPRYQDWWFFRFTEGSAIVDADTGDRYMLRSMEHFPMNQCFWIYGQAGETIRLVGVYPPLPSSVKRVQLYEAAAPSRRWMDGSASLTKVYKVNELRPNPGPTPKKAGRIIR